MTFENIDGGSCSSSGPVVLSTCVPFLMGIAGFAENLISSYIYVVVSRGSSGYFSHISQEIIRKK